MLFLGLAFATLAFAQNPSSLLTPPSTTAFDAGVPTDAPVPGDYNGQWRPQLHFSPPSNFMNDPNGCFLDANGTWHLFYQCKSPST